jgi:hypothetical protein
MRKGFVYQAAATITLLLSAASLSFAMSWFSHNSTEKTVRVHILYPAQIAKGVQLKAGTYRMQVPLNTQTAAIAFYQNGEVVARAHARLVSETKKNDMTEIYFNNKGNQHVITEIRPSGMREKVIFSNAVSSTKSGA